MSSDDRPIGDETPESMPDVKPKLLALLKERGFEKTICPSEVARSLREEDWRGLMPRVREAAGELVEQGIAEVTQAGEPVDPVKATGPIRIGLVTGADPDER